MLAEFCLRLALGMVAFLPLLPADRMHPRFFRTQFLTALGLSVVAAVAAWSGSDATSRWILLGGVVVGLAGSLAWTLDPPPLGRLWGPLASAVYFAGIGWSRQGDSIAAINAVSSALLIGVAVTAMLVGHSYLISPGLSIRPLMTMLLAGLAVLTLRVVVLLFGITLFTGEIPIDATLWLVPRWAIGIGGPAILGFMTWRTALIHSTQSATGILYVVVICSFLGELLGMLISRTTGVPA